MAAISRSKTSVVISFPSSHILAKAVYMIRYSSCSFSDSSALKCLNLAFGKPLLSNWITSL